MKVVKKSELIKEQEKPWVIEVQCGDESKSGSKGCGSMLEVEEKDLKCFRREDKESIEDYLSVICPVCGSILLSLRKKVPTYVCLRWFKKHRNAKCIRDDAEPYA